MSHFITYLALGKAVELQTAAALVALKELVGDAPISVSLQADKLVAPQSGFIVAINSIAVSVICMNQSLPTEAWETAAKQNLTWKSAAESFSKNSAHIVVAALPQSRDHITAVAGAFAVTIVAGAIAKNLRPLGVVFAESNAAVEGNLIIAMAKNLAKHRELPVLLWASLQFMRSEVLNKGRPDIGGITTGLLPFIGREIEFETTALLPSEVAQRVFGLCQYLMLNGPVVKDGDSVGNTPEEKIVATFVDEGRRKGIQVLRLTMVLQAISGTPVRATTSAVFGKKAS
jgi:Domain of unknown function (DUF4261)